MSNAFRFAPPRTRGEIEEVAWRARHDLGLRPFDRVPIARLLDLVLPDMIEGYELRIAEHDALEGAEAITDVARPIITIDDHVYRDMCRDHHRPRMTGAHELGHLLLHTGRSAKTGLAFMPTRDRRTNFEKQADVFAAAFMMPECAFQQVRSIREAMSRFGVSRDAACCRARSLKMWWLISNSPPPRRRKKKGYSRSRTP